MANCTSRIALAKQDAPVLVVKDDIQTQWMKKGDAANFDGILISEKAYEGLREKLIRQQAALGDCHK